MKRVVVIVSMTLLAACKPQEEHIDSSQRLAVLEEVMESQENSWNSGDLEGFMQAYTPSDSLVFIGSRGLTYGWQTTLNNYKKSYPDQQAMGKLEFKNLEFKDLSKDYSLLIGSWHLYRESDTLQGSYSLIWEWKNGKPRIIADHSS